MKPMKQGVISAFKASYLTRTFRQVVGATVGDRAFSVAEFWKKYNMHHALENLQASRQEVPVSGMCRIVGALTPLCK